MTIRMPGFIQALRNRRVFLHSLFGGILLFSGIAASAYEYDLSPELIAPNTYLITGSKDDFTRQNGGDIVNIAFIVTQDGVVVIDSGPSFQYGQQLRNTIGEITTQPIAQMLITHQHPDHIFGVQAFKDVPVLALPETIEHIAEESENSLDHLYRIVGDAMKSTENVAFFKPLTVETEQFGSHTLRYLKLAGHSQTDLVIVDETTGVVFASDLVFANRAATTPHANVAAWLDSLNTIEALAPTILVPGHGDLIEPRRAIAQTRAYLRWVDQTIHNAVETGLDMHQTMALPVPRDFHDLSGVEREYDRSVVHLYLQYEAEMFEREAQQVGVFDIPAPYKEQAN